METIATHPAATDSGPAPSLGKSPALKILGIGNAGVNLVAELRQSEWESAAFAVVSDDRQALARSSATEKIHLEFKAAAGSAGRRGERVGRVPDNTWPELKAVCNDAQTVLVVAGLGGRFGTDLSLAAVKSAKQAGAFTLAFVSLPFDCEGSLRQHHAQTGLTEICAVADAVFCLPNQKTFSLIKDETNLAETFKISNQLLTDCLRGVYLALTATRVAIGLPFSDLCALAQEQKGITAFVVTEAAGTNRAGEVLEKLLKHPLAEGGRVRSEASTILVSMVGGTDLTIAEVNRVMEGINAQCQGTPVVMGAGVRPSSKGLAVVLMAVKTSEAGKMEGTEDGASQGTLTGVSAGMVSGLDKQIAGITPAAQPGCRFVSLLPGLSSEPGERGMAQHAGAAARQRKNAPRLRQTQLPLEIVSKGRFNKSEPTIHKGEDLDVPTFMRRGVVLN